MKYWRKLIIPILKQATRDYIAALLKNNFHKIAELEDFFLSDYGQAMSLNNGEEIIEICKLKANKKMKARRNETLNRNNGNTPPRN